MVTYVGSVELFIIVQYTVVLSEVIGCFRTNTSILLLGTHVPEDGISFVSVVQLLNYVFSF